jgi:hypothetical protein
MTDANPSTPSRRSPPARARLSQQLNDAAARLQSEAPVE